MVSWMYNSMQDVRAEIINPLSRRCVEFGNKNEKREIKKRLSGIFRDSEPELYQISHLFIRSISVLQSFLSVETIINR